MKKRKHLFHLSFIRYYEICFSHDHPFQAKSILMSKLQTSFVICLGAMDMEWPFLSRLSNIHTPTNDK